MRVIVADDEKLVRAAVVGTIPFKKLGMTLVSQASNGIEALALCQQHKPDILVTDIAMPGLTGLELIKELKRILPDIKIVIISGYSDFDYAKQAIGLGVQDYILKPVDEKEISQVLLCVKKMIIEERNRKEEESTNKVQYQQALPVMLERFMNELIQYNTYTTEFIINTLRHHELHLHDPYFCIAVFSLDGPHCTNPKMESTNYKKVTARFSQKYFNGILFQKTGTDNELVCIMNHKCSTHIHPKDDNPFMDREFNLYLRLIQRKYKRTVSVGFSLSSNLLNSLPELYLQASKSLQDRFWKGYGNLHRYSSSSFSDQIEIKLSEKVLEDIAMNIRMSNIKPALDYLNTLHTCFINSAKAEPEEVKDLFWTFLQLLTGRLDISLRFIKKDSTLFHSHPYESLKGMDSMDKLHCYMEEAIQRIYHYYREEHAMNGPDLIEVAKKIILRNLANDISLEQISGCVHLTPTYFSAFFKKETGMSYVDYKTTLRIEQAKILLETTQLNLNDISSQVGYSDPKYFSRLYKKYTGSLPHEHRKKALPFTNL